MRESGIRVQSPLMLGQRARACVREAPGIFAAACMQSARMRGRAENKHLFASARMRGCVALRAHGIALAKAASVAGHCSQHRVAKNGDNLLTVQKLLFTFRKTQQGKRSE